MLLKTARLAHWLVWSYSSRVNGTALSAERSYPKAPSCRSGRSAPARHVRRRYLKYLAGPYKQWMEEQKKAGIILDYAVYQATPRGPQRPGSDLTVVYKNMAALDGLDARTDPISEKIFGSMEQSTRRSAERGKMRTLIGGS